jgi:hypothetical protein
MRAPPDKDQSPALATPGSLEDAHAGRLNTPRNKSPRGRAQALTVIGSVPKSHTSQLRVSVSEWRGERKLELHETTRVMGEAFFPAGTPVTLSIDKVPELIELLCKAVQR